MKVVFKSLSEEASDNRDFRQELIIEIDGEKVFNVLDDEPEDSNLSRSFSDCWNIESLMKKAYLAGKNGEEFITEDIEIND